MRFPSRDYTLQFISASYKDVVQQYIPTGSTLFLLDLLGNVILSIPSASFGQEVLTADQTASWAVSASWAPGSSPGTTIYTGSTYPVTASWAFNAQDAVSSSYSFFAMTALISDVSLLSDTASIAVFAETADSASWASSSISASFAANAGTSSFALNAGSGGTTIITSSLVPITSSWAVSASWAPGSDAVSSVSASWASQSFSSSYSEKAGTASFALNAGSGGTSTVTGSLVPVTSSWAVSASWAPSTPSDTAISASWASASFSSSYSEKAGTASFALNAGSGGTTIVTSSLVPITASWSQNSLTASYIAIIPSGSTESASYAVTASYAETADHVNNNGLSIPKYDYSNVTYLGPLGNVDQCTYRSGGISGSIVCIVTLLYSGSIFTGVSKSLG